MEITELLPELITKLAPTGPLPTTTPAQLAYWRELVTLREPGYLPTDYLQKEDELLELLWQKRPLVTLEELDEVVPGLYLYQGDITTLQVEAFVDPADPDLLGCFDPTHPCLDNEVHVFSGSRLRETGHKLKQAGKTPLASGQTYVNPGHHLPAKYVIQAIAPTVHGVLQPEQIEALRSCYAGIFEAVTKYQIKTIALCALGTGAANFPNELAAKIAITAAKKAQAKDPSLKIVLTPYKDLDLNLYRYLLTDE